MSAGAKAHSRCFEVLDRAVQGNGDVDGLKLHVQIPHKVQAGLPLAAQQNQLVDFG